MKIRLFLVVCALALSACTTIGPGGAPLSPTQQAINATATSYAALDSAIVAADSAVKSGVLKSGDARNALKGLTDAKNGLDIALFSLRAANAAAAATPASGAKP